MVELDKLKKINELANELKKHKFAATNDEAAKLAEDFYTQKKDIPEEPISEKIEKADELTIKKFELIMEIQHKQLKSELETQKATMILLHKKIEELKIEVETLKGKALSSPIQFEKKKDEPEVQASLSKPKKEEKKENPRSGDYTSEDVDIQKMFYFGNK